MNYSDSSGLDHSRLEYVRQIGEKILARCPACAENGGDNRAEHLVIFETGQFGCAAFPGDHRHRRRIFELVGIVTKHEMDPEQIRRRQQELVRVQRDEQEKLRLINVARAKRATIIDGHLWNSEEIMESSPQRIDCVQLSSQQWGVFLRRLGANPRPCQHRGFLK